MFKKIVWKTLKICGITVASLFALMFLLPILFPKTISDKIKSWTNSTISGEMNFSKARLSFFKHFPSLTLTLYDFSLKGSAPFKSDTLIAAKELGMGVNLMSIFSKSLSIDKFYLADGNIQILVDSAGHANYNVYKSSNTTKENSDTSGTALNLQKIQIDHCNLIYDDHSIPIRIAANDLNYLGRGDLAKSLFDLYSHIAINSFDLSYGNSSYMLSKKLEGDLITRINTHSLAFDFQKNDLKINALPVQLNGHFGFLSNGYTMDFKLQSKKSQLHDIVTVLPPEYLKWLEQTEVKGYAEMDATLGGKYIAATGEMPSLTFNMKIRNGFVNHAKAPTPISNLYLDFQTSIPGFNMDSAYVNIDSLFFNMDKDYLSMVMKLRNINRPELHTRLRADMDLEKWNAATGYKDIHFKGRLAAQFNADGSFRRGIVQKGTLRKSADSALVSIPRFNLTATLQNGYAKIDTLPGSLDQASFRLVAQCPDSIKEHAVINLDDLNATALGSYVKGFFHLKNGKVPLINANLKSVIHLQDIKKFYPLQKGLEIAGDLNLDGSLNGQFLPEKRKTPVTILKLKLDNGLVKTNNFPESIQNLRIDATVVNKSTSLKTMVVNLKPVSFTFAGQPFFLKADLKNFDNLQYHVYSKGGIDIAKIYKVFAQKGYDVTGKVYTNFSLDGLQSDALAGNYSKLNNKGMLRVEDIKLSSELFPLPLLIQKGLFRFDQDKMWFDKFNAQYGKSTFVLDGYLNNVIGYATQQNQALHGNFGLHSPYIQADDFMFFANESSANSTQKTSSGNSGVVMVPDNIDLQFNAAVNKLLFKGLAINDINGGMRVLKKAIELDSLKFNVIGAPIDMQAKYTSQTPTSATFDYHITAKEFDIKKAYTDIAFVREMMTSAKGAEGIVGLDYQIGGRLDKNMSPVLKSLKGQGVLSVKKVKMKGFKLFNAVSRSTGKDKIVDPDVSKIDIKSKIENNIMTIERTKLRVAGFRPRFEGQIGLDGRLNLNARLGLPPFGIFGIPFTVTGTQDKPKINLRRGRNSDKLEEEADDEKDKE